MDFEPSHTIFLRKQKRTRARITLPMEMCLFSLLLSVTLAAGLGYGLIGKLLAESASDAVWLLTAGPIAVAGLVVATIEWGCGEKWDDAQVRRICLARKYLGLGAIVMWSCLALIIYAAAGAVAPALGQALVATVFHGWAVLLCKRTYVILTPGFDTRKLEDDLERKRLAV